MNKSTATTLIAMFVITLLSLSIQASELDKGKREVSLSSAPTMEEVPYLIQNLEKESQVHFMLTFEDENKTIYVADKTVIIAEQQIDGVEVKVLCASRKPNKEYKKVVGALKDNPALSTPMSTLK